MLKMKAFAITLADQPTTVGASVVPNRIQLIRCGSFSSDQYGKFKVTPDMLKSFVANFDDNARGYPDKKLPIDYFHENEKIAAGWIDSLELDDNGESLYALVSWTPRGEKHLADKELRYVSAEFHFNYVSNEGGKKFGPTLLGAGLTNRPFIKGMDAVVELSEGDNMDLNAALAKIAELEKKIQEMSGQSAGQSAELADAKKKLGDYEAAAKKAADEKALADKAAADQKATDEKKGQFDKMLSEGKAVEAQREAFMSGDVIKFAELASSVKLSATGTGAGGNAGGGAKDAQEEILELASKKAREEKISLSDAIKAVQLANPTLTEKYRKEVAFTG